MAIEVHQLFELAELEISPAFALGLERRLGEPLPPVVGVGDGNEARVVADVTGGGRKGRERIAGWPRRTWALLGAAALVLAVSIGAGAVVVVHQIRPVSPHPIPNPPRLPSVTTTILAPSKNVTRTTSPATTAPTTTPPATVPTSPTTTAPSTSVGPLALRHNGTLDNIHHLDLDPWRVGAPMWSTTDKGGPYLVFDANPPPSGWKLDGAVRTTISVGGEHRWDANLVSTTGQKALVSIGSPWLPGLDGLTSGTTVRGHYSSESDNTNTASIVWLEQPGIQAMVSVAGSLNALPQTRALAEALQTTLVDSLDAVPVWPGPLGPIVEVGAPELGGSIGGHAWSVDTGGSTTTHELYPRVDGVLFLDATDGGNPPDNRVTLEAVMGGVLVLGVMAKQVDHAVAILSDGTRIHVAGYHWPDRTGIVVPIPTGLDVVTIDFSDKAGNKLRSTSVPEFPPGVSGYTQVEAVDAATGQ